LSIVLKKLVGIHFRIPFFANLSTFLVFLTIALTVNLANCAAVKNEIGVLRASGDIAHSLLELLAGGRINVNENQSQLTALRARLQDRPQQSGISKFDGKFLVVFL
jgi:hypothetical protein